MKKDIEWFLNEINKIYQEVVRGEKSFNEEALLFHIATIARDMDEPEKPVVPQFVAEHIIRQKELTATLLQAIGRIKLSGTEMVNWITTDGNDVLFCKAWLYGYEVEKEILWEIPLPDLKTSDGDIQYLTYDHKAKTYFASRRNAQLKQAFNAKDLASVPTPHRHYAVLCDFNKKSRR